MVVNEHGLQTFEVVVVVMLLLLLWFDVFFPTNAHPLLFLDKWFVQIYSNDSYTVKGGTGEIGIERRNRYNH